MAIPAAIVGAISSGEATVAAITSGINKGTRESENIVKRAINGIKSAFTDLADQFDKLKSVILDTTKAFAPFTIVMFNRAMLDLKATLGQIFIPIVKQAISVVRILADTIYNLPDGAKTMIRAVTEIVLAISGVTAVSVGVVGAIAAVVLGFVGLAAGLAVVGVLLVTFGTILAAILAPFVLLTVAITAALTPVAALAIGLVALVRMLLQTEGGIGLLRNIMRGFDQIVNTVRAGWATIMRIIGPVIDQLYDSLSQLGNALSELFDALKPIIAAGLLIAVSALAVVLTALAKAVTVAVQVITFALNLISKIPAIRMLRALGEMMPESEDKKSSYGLGWSAAHVDTDPNAIYNRITEELLRNTRMGAGEAEADPAKQTAKNTTTISTLLQQLYDYLKEQGQPGNVVKNVQLGGLGLILR